MKQGVSGCASGGESQLCGRGDLRPRQANSLIGAQWENGGLPKSHVQCGWMGWAEVRGRREDKLRKEDWC